MQISSTIHAWGTSKSDAQKNLEKLDLAMTQVGNKIRIRHETHVSVTFGIHIGSQIKLDILMPAEADLRFSLDDGVIDIRDMSGSFDITTDDGDIDLTNVTGAFELESDDGDISVHNGTGSLSAVTDDGDIMFRGRLTGPRHSMYAEDGDITVTLPADLNLHIDVSTDDGTFHSSLPFSNEIRHEHHWTATLNAPDITLNIRTDDGDISIRELIEG